jgi:hypothetical protein
MAFNLVLKLHLLTLPLDITTYQYSHMQTNLYHNNPTKMVDQCKTDMLKVVEKHKYL